MDFWNGNDCCDCAEHVVDNIKSQVACDIFSDRLRMQDCSLLYYAIQS
jgi:hypothetical protein